MNAQMKELPAIDFTNPGDPLAVEHDFKEYCLVHGIDQRLGMLCTMICNMVPMIKLGVEKMCDNQEALVNATRDLIIGVMARSISDAMEFGVQAGVIKKEELV